ncbi:MAG TPA: ABC transporter substrate-binding protein [Actinophytocola sp.]|jgi:ABC-type nitrate/sulfonate/bicarbonate transport system substrate-binding protein|nr:ABC transporter substrate-binding protein [Actinophytocola sp.]
MPKSRTRTLAVLSILLLVVSACSRPGAAAQQSDDGTIHVTLALSSLTILLGLPLVAQDDGLFTKNGLKVDEVVANSASDAVNIALSGDADFVMTAAPAVFSLNGDGQAVQFLANAYSGLAASVVMSPDVAKRTGVAPDAPIEDRLKALDGLHMSFASPSSGYLTVMQSALKLVGAKIQPVFIEQASMPAALKQHKIDVLIASPPVSDIAVRDGGTLWISGPKGDLPEGVQPPMTTAAAATKRFVDANPEAAKRFVKSLEDAAKFIESDPDAAGTLLEKRFPELDKDLFDASWTANKTAFSHVGIDADLLDRQRKTLAKDELTPEVQALDMKDLICPCAPKP